MNIAGSANALEKQLVRRELTGGKQVGKTVERAFHFFPRGAGVESAVQMGMKLALLT